MTDATEQQQDPVHKPLRLVGLGLLILMLRPDYRGYDLLPDTIGWLLVLVGSAVFARGLPTRSGIMWAAGLAAVSAAAIWPPHWEDVVRDQEQSLVWAILLPQIVWSVLFCLAVTGVSRADLGASIWWKYLALVNIAVGVLPILVYGGGMSSLESTLETLNFLGLLAGIVLSFWHASRPWATVAAPERRSERE